MEERKEKGGKGERGREGRGGQRAGECRNFVTSHNPSVCNVQTGNSKERKQGCQAGEGTGGVYIRVYLSVDALNATVY